MLVKLASQVGLVGPTTSHNFYPSCSSYGETSFRRAATLFVLLWENHPWRGGIDPCSRQCENV